MTELFTVVSSLDNIQLTITNIRAGPDTGLSREENPPFMKI